MDLIKRLWNTYTWQPKLIALGVLLVLILVVVFSFKACGKREPKLPIQEVTKAQDAIAKGDRAQQVEILSNSDVQEQIADGIIDNSKSAAINAKIDSKQKWNAASDEDVRAELEARAKQ